MRPRKTNNQPRSPKFRTQNQSPISRYYRSETETKSQSPFIKKTPKNTRRKYIAGFLDIILVGAIILGLGYSLMLEPRPKVIVSDTSFHQISDYAKATTKQFSSFKNRNKITFNQKGIVDDLQSQFPEISTVDVELPFFSEQPVVRLAISKPSFKLQSKDKVYVVNQEGIAIDLASKLPKMRSLTLISDQSGFNITPGDRVLGVASVNFIDNLIRQCRHAKVPISSIELPKTPEELILRTSDQRYYAKFYLGGDVVTQSGQFLAARAHFNDAGNQPGQYLDLRISGKIFYR